MSRDSLPFPTYGDEATVVEEHAAAPAFGLRLLRPSPPPRVVAEPTQPITWRFHAVAAEREAEAQRAAWRAGLGVGARTVAPVRRSAGGVVDAEGATVPIAVGEANGPVPTPAAKAAGPGDAGKGGGATARAAPAVGPRGGRAAGASADAARAPEPAATSTPPSGRARPGRRLGLGDAPAIVWEPPGRGEGHAASTRSTPQSSPRARRPSRAWLAIGLLAIPAIVGPLLGALALLVTLELLAPILAAVAGVAAIGAAVAAAAALLLGWLLRAARAG